LATARSCLPTDTDFAVIDSLSKCIEIGYNYSMSVLKDDSRPIFSVHEGRYAHLVLDRQLGELNGLYQVYESFVRIPTPPLPTLEVEESTFDIPVRYVFFRCKQLQQIHLLTGHGSIANFPSPLAEVRYRMAVGIVGDLISVLLTCRTGVTTIWCRYQEVPSRVHTWTCTAVKTSLVSWG